MAAEQEHAPGLEDAEDLSQALKSSRERIDAVDSVVAEKRGVEARITEGEPSSVHHLEVAGPVTLACPS